MSEPMFCRFCGKPLVNGECSCEEFQKAKMKAANPAGATDTGAANTDSTGSNNTFNAEAAKQAFNGMKDKVVNIVDNEGKQINADNDSIYERNIPIVPNCVQPEQDEVMIRQYNIAILRTRLKFMRAEGRLEVTNKRVLFRAAGKCTKGPVLQEHEFKLDEIGGIEIHSDYKFSLMNFFLFILLEVLILLPSISTTMAASAYDYYGGNRGGSTAVAVLCVVLGFAAAAGSVYMKRISIISDLLAVASTFCFMTSWGKTQNGFLQFLAVVSWIFLIVMLLINSLVPNLVLKIKTKGGSGAVVIGSQKAIYRRKSGDDYSGFAEILPWEDTELAINELGTMIADLQQQGNYAVEKWTK